MYHYISDKQFLKQMHRVCADILNQLVQQINNDGCMEVDAFTVGSFPKNLITQNENEPIDIDFNLCILNTYQININDGRQIKEYIRNQFNIVLKRNGWGDCKDSTSVLTTEKRYFTTGNPTSFSIDLAIVKRAEDTKTTYRLIHRKTGSAITDQHPWNEAPHSKNLDEKASKLKQENLWLEVRDLYLDKKNMYLKRQENTHPSFNVYIETINEIFNKYFD